jgi:hypothetical protein
VVVRTSTSLTPRSRGVALAIRTPGFLPVREGGKDVSVAILPVCAFLSFLEAHFGARNSKPVTKSKSEIAVTKL